MQKMVTKSKHFDFDEMTIQEAIEEFKELGNIFGINSRITMTAYEDELDCRITYDILETELEAKAREEREFQYRLLREERELKELKRLQDLYGEK